MTTSFGRDVSCTTSIRSGRFVSGPRLVGEALFRRFTTPRGLLRGGEEEANYGYDLTAKIGSAKTAAQKAALPGELQNEALKDERIESCSAAVVETKTGPAIAWDVTITALTLEGPFTLQIRVTELTVDLVGLSVEA